MPLHFQGYLEQGLLVLNSNKLLVNYISSKKLKLDIISLIPTDLFYFTTGLTCKNEQIPCPVIVRLNRLFKLHRLFEYLDRTETLTNYPNAFRICQLIFTILVVIHWNACFYFAMSSVIGTCFCLYFASFGWQTLDPTYLNSNYNLCKQKRVLKCVCVIL